MTLATYNFWSVAGLVYALAGAALICNAVFLIPPPSHQVASSGDLEGHRAALRRMSRQWLDTRVGSALLLIGFFLQATGAIGTEKLNTPAVFALLALAIFAGYYAMLRDLRAEHITPSEAGQDQHPVETTEIDESKPPLVAPIQTPLQMTVLEEQRNETAA